MKEMKLYAVRDKSTGEFVKDNLGRVVASEHIISAPVSSRSREEIINLRIEPTEPCTWCKPASWKVFDERMKFCDQCGRSLT